MTMAEINESEQDEAQAAAMAATSQETMVLPEDTDQEFLLPAKNGEGPGATFIDYGDDGSAEVTRLVLREVPGAQAPGQLYMALSVAYDHPEVGRVFIEARPFSRSYHTKTASKSGSNMRKFLVQLGLQPIFAAHPDENGNYLYAGPEGDPQGVKVVFHADIETWKDKKAGPGPDGKPQLRHKNVLANVWRRDA